MSAPCAKRLTCLLSFKPHRNSEVGAGTEGEKGSWSEGTNRTVASDTGNINDGFISTKRGSRRI